MNPESPKLEKIEEGTDLYDGMIFKFFENDEYINKLDIFTLKKIKERLEEYYEIMDDADHTKGEELTERLGVFINKYKIKEILDFVNLLLVKDAKELDKIDDEILYFMDNYEKLEYVQYESLIEFRKRLMLYAEILENGNEKEKEDLFEKFGHYLAKDSVIDMLQHVHVLINVIEQEGED